MSETVPSRAPVSANLPPAKPSPRFLGFDVTLDWLMRPLFGIGLAAIAVTATIYGGYYFALFISAGAIAAAREWHRMRAGGKFGLFVIVSAIGIAGATGGEVFLSHANASREGLPWLLLVACALINSALGSTRRVEALWHAASLLYIGVPALCLVTIREVLPNGFWLLIALFAAVWMTDTGALLAGNLLRGPKLWPALSPNKTWAGFLGGILFGAVASASVFAFKHANVMDGFAFGALAALVGHAGDLFESWLKRRVGRKNSGSLIPGHGGVLDRIDSMLFVAPVAALLLVAMHINPMATVVT